MGDTRRVGRAGGWVVTLPSLEWACRECWQGEGRGGRFGPLGIGWGKRMVAAALQDPVAHLGAPKLDDQ